MKRTGSMLLAVLLLCASFLTAAVAEGFIEEDEFSMEVEELDMDDVLWTFPVALKDMNPEYIILANKHYLLDSGYVPADLVKVPSDPKKGGIKWASSAKDGKLNGWYLRKDCAEALCAMNAEMREIKGFQTMYLKSAYRSYAKQKSMYDARLKKNKGKDDGWVAKPGSSDHQTGLGCDVVPNNWKNKGMNEKMIREEECEWMAKNCQRYGFIIRYPFDKTEITEINPEPWHLRYVGVPAATYIMENGLTLEEFTDELQAAIADYIARGGNPAKVEKYIQNPTDQ